MKFFTMGVEIDGKVSLKDKSVKDKIIKTNDIYWETKRQNTALMINTVKEKVRNLQFYIGEKIRKIVNLNIR